MARGQAKNPNYNNFQLAALLSQSGIKFGHLRLFKLHQNLPQFFAETMSPTVFWFFDLFRRDHVADELWVILGSHRRNIIITLDFQHAGQNFMDSG